MKLKIFAALIAGALLSAHDSARAQNSGIFVTAGFPGGNVVVDSVRGNTVYIRPDLRDTGQDWFYWYFAVTPARNDSIHFRFTKPNCLTVKGPAVSTDKGKSWKWLTPDKASPNGFAYYGKAGEETRFSMGMPYTQENFNRFIKPFRKHPSVRIESLCTTPKGRSVEQLTIAPAGNKAAGQKVLITARHHACEMMANYVLEGIIGTLLSKDGRMASLRDRVEFRIIPFVDKDGVEDGDQGKARTPRDHNRDYDGKSLYCTTNALRHTVPEWSDGKLKAALDLHCPWIKGNLNEHIYLVGNAREEIAGEQDIFMRMIAQNNRGALKFSTEKGIVPFGTAWNTSRNYEQGMSFAAWASTLDAIKLSTTFEIPYSVHDGQLLTPENLRDFGKDLAFALFQYLGRIE